MTQILLRYSKDRSCNKLASLVDPGLDLGIFKGLEEDPCDILNMNSRITQKNISKFYVIYTMCDRNVFFV